MSAPERAVPRFERRDLPGGGWSLSAVCEPDGYCANHHICGTLDVGIVTEHIDTIMQRHPEQHTPECRAYGELTQPDWRPTNRYCIADCADTRRVAALIRRLWWGDL